MERTPEQEDRKIIITGVILALIVVVICAAAFILLRNYFGSARRDSGISSARLSEILKEDRRNVPTPPPMESAVADIFTEEIAAFVPVAVIYPETQHAVPDSYVSPSMSDYNYQNPAAYNATPVPAASITAYVALSSDVDMSGYYQTGIIAAAATSTIMQEGIDNSAYMVLDGNPVTSWQEGVEGYGEGQKIALAFDRVYAVRYIVFRLGNWRDADSWRNNGRPSTLTVWIGGAAYTISFADTMSEYCLMFSGDIPATDLSITIDGVYKGDIYEDTCISDIIVFGK